MLHLSPMPSVFLLLMWKKLVTMPSGWFLHQLWGVERVGIEWGVCSKLVNIPNLVLKSILLIGTYVDFD